MNNRWKLITAILLTIAMAFSGTYVFAGTGTQSSNDEDIAAVDVTAEPETDETAAPEEVVQEEIVPEQEGPGGTVSAMAMTDVSVISTSGVSVNATTVNSTAPSKLSLDWSKPISFPVTGSGKCIRVPVNVKTSGMLWFDAQRTDSNSYGASIFVGKYDSSTNKIKYVQYRYAYVSSGEDPTKGIGGISVSKGTYYIGIESTLNSGSMKVRAYVYPYATRTLSANKYMMTSGYKTTSDGSYANSTTLFKIKPSKTGYIRVYLKEYGFDNSSGDVKLLNSKKKTVSDKLWFYDGASGYSVPFGVKKGKTYYLKVTETYGNSSALYVYGIKYKIFAAPARSNTSKSKAKKLKRKAKYIKTAMLANGKSGTQWYKFKVTKKRATRIMLDATYLKSGKTTVTFYCGKKKLASTQTVSNGRVNGWDLTYSTSYGKCKKGTYYVKVSKSKKATGQYKIKYAK